jgi:hypothetical protein
MNRKAFFVVAVVLLAFAVGFCNLLTCETHGSQGHDPGPKALTAASAKFGPVIETVLPGANENERAQILNLETGHALPEPLFEAFGFRADAIITWIRTNGLDISCSVWSNLAACTTYEMILVPVERKCWDETTAEELVHNPALAPRHAPRRLLVLARNRPDTYLFRTGEGTLGMLRLDGLSKDGRGVKIRYKLINPAKLVSVAP